MPHLHLRMILSLAAAVLLLNACTAPRSSMSYVDPEVTTLDTQILAADSVAYLANLLPPARTTLRLDPPLIAQHDALTAPLIRALRACGYGVAVVDPKTGKATGRGTSLRYLVSPLDGGVVLRLQFLGIEATRFYPRARSGHLLSSAALFTVRGGPQ